MSVCLSLSVCLCLFICLSVFLSLSLSLTLFLLFLSLHIRFGYAKITITDQGRKFINQVSTHNFVLTGTQHNISSAYHPHTNSFVEQFNQTLYSIHLWNWWKIISQSGTFILMQSCLHSEQHHISPQKSFHLRSRTAGIYAHLHFWYWGVTIFCVTIHGH